MEGLTTTNIPAQKLATTYSRLSPVDTSFESYTWDEFLFPQDPESYGFKMNQGWVDILNRYAGMASGLSDYTLSQIIMYTKDLRGRLHCLDDIEAELQVLDHGFMVGLHGALARGQDA